VIDERLVHRPEQKMPTAAANSASANRLRGDAGGSLAGRYASRRAAISERGWSGGGVGRSQGIGTAASLHRFASGQADR
jgi:hypothetical protein